MGKRALGRGNSMCKGPGASEGDLVWLEDGKVASDEAWNIGSTLRAMGGCFDFPVNHQKPWTNLEQGRE